MAKRRITLFVLHTDDATDFKRVKAWLKKWGAVVRVHDHSSGGWEHCWDLEAPMQALFGLPKHFFCASDWANYPAAIGQAPDPAWATHPEDGVQDVG